MIIKGKGQQLGEDITRLARTEIKTDEFRRLYGDAVYNVVQDNFILPVQRAAIEKNKEKIKTIMDSVALFAASFI